MRLTVDRRVVTRVEIDIPPEILVNVFRQLVDAESYESLSLRYADLVDYTDFRGSYIRDIKNARLVSKAFNFAASPFLISSVYISSSQQDMDVLKAISEHPTFRLHVREVIYDNRMFQQDLATDTAVYVNAIKNNPFPRCRVSASNKNLVKKGFQEYRMHFRQQQESRAKGLDMQCLRDAFIRMPNLVNARINGRDRMRYVSAFGSENVERRVTGKHVIPPMGITSWTTHHADVTPHYTACQKGFQDFLSTLSSADIARQLRSVSFGQAIEEEVLIFSPDESITLVEQQFSSLFEHLTKLQLCVKLGRGNVDFIPRRQVPPPNDPLVEAETALWKAMFKRVLSTARDLQTLQLRFAPSYRYRVVTQNSVVTFKDVLDEDSFPKLQDLKLGSLSSHPTELLNFFQLHRGVLKHVALNGINLTPPATWVEVVDNMKELDLSLESCSLFVIDDGWMHQSFRGKDLIEYFNGGDQNPLIEVTAADLASEVDVDEAARV